MVVSVTGMSGKVSFTLGSSAALFRGGLIFVGSFWCHGLLALILAVSWDDIARTASIDVGSEMGVPFLVVSLFLGLEM